MPQRVSVRLGDPARGSPEQRSSAFYGFLEQDSRSDDTVAAALRREVVFL